MIDWILDQWADEFKKNQGKPAQRVIRWQAHAIKHLLTEKKHTISQKNRLMKNLSSWSINYEKESKSFTFISYGKELAKWQANAHPVSLKEDRYGTSIKKFMVVALSESTNTSSLAEAERYLMHRLEEIRLASIYGVRPTRTFRQAALKFLH